MPNPLNPYAPPDLSSYWSYSPPTTGYEQGNNPFSLDVGNFLNKLFSNIFQGSGSSTIENFANQAYNFANQMAQTKASMTNPNSNVTSAPRNNLAKATPAQQAEQATKAQVVQETANQPNNQMNYSTGSGPDPNGIPVVPPTGRFADSIQKYATQYNVPAALIQAVIDQESQGNPAVVSRTGNRGLMQLSDQILNNYGIKDWTNPDSNIGGGTRYLSELYGQYGDWNKALRAYYAGPNGVTNPGLADPSGVTADQYASKVMSRIPRPKQITTQQVASQPQNPTDTVPNIFNAGLSMYDAVKACGPAAAVSFVQKFGRTPTLSEAYKLAIKNGFHNGNEMNGPGAEVGLINSLAGNNVAQLHNTLDWNAINQDIAANKPVVISTSGHYYVPQAYDQNTNKYFVGNSGTTLATRPSAWMSPDEIVNSQTYGPFNGWIDAIMGQ